MKKLFLLFLFVPGLAFADRLDDLKDELDQVKAELEQLDEVQPEPAYVDTNDPEQVRENQRELKEMFPSYFQ
jgi:proline dehydrogenase